MRIAVVGASADTGRQVVRLLCDAGSSGYLNGVVVPINGGQHFG